MPPTSLQVVSIDPNSGWLEAAKLLEEATRAMSSSISTMDLGSPSDQMVQLVLHTNLYWLQGLPLLPIQQPAPWTMLVLFVLGKDYDNQTNPIETTRTET